MELSKDWRTDRVLRRLEALLVVARPRSRCSCSPARATSSSPTTACWRWAAEGRTRSPRPGRSSRTRDLDAATLAREAMKIAAGICIYTNDHIIVETL